MERREFLKFAFGFAAGATALAASANAAPLLPATPAGSAPRADAAVEPAVAAQDDVDRLQPEQVRWHGGGRRHFGGFHRGHGFHRHHRHWGWRRHHGHRRRWPHHRRRHFI